jgi:hypothetical protein
MKETGRVWEDRLEAAPREMLDGVSAVDDLHGPPGRRSVGDWLYGFVQRYEIAWLVFVCLVVFGAALVGSRHKHFWCDEIFTIIVASQPTWHRLAQAMPGDGHPPVTALLTRLSIHLFGITNFSVRLPETLGILSALAGVYIFVRREVGEVFGLFAVAIVIAQPAWMYSFEARPYGVIVAFIMLGMVSWQSATRAADATVPRGRWLALAGVVVAVAGCILTHHLGVVSIGVPLIFGESVRLYWRRRLDWPLALTALVAALAALSISLPMIHRTNQLLFVHLSKITAHNFRENYAHAATSFPAVFSANVLELLAGLVLVTWCPWFLNRFHDRAKIPVPAPARPVAAPHVLSAAIGLVLLVPITFFIMAVQGGWYFCRYGIGSIFGLAILVSLVLARQTPRRSVLVVCVFLFLALSFARAFLQNVRHRQDDPGDDLVYQDQSGLPIVVSDPLLYPQIWWYAPDAMKNQTIYLYDTPLTMQGGVALIDAALVSERTLITAPLQPYDSFTKTHEHFLFDAGPMDADLKETLEARGYRATFLRGNESEKIYDVQRESGKP